MEIPLEHPPLPLLWDLLPGMMGLSGKCPVKKLSLMVTHL